MNHILSLLPVFPIVLLVTAVLYAAVYLMFKKKREKPGKGRMLAEFALLGWVVMFVYVTQVMPFGNGMGERINLQPLRGFLTAFRYGSENASGVWQFLLNIIMFVPLGLLLPIVFKKLRSWHGVLLVSLACTVITELLQQITSRGTDIDDVIANTLGGLCGFALYLILAGIVFALRKKQNPIPKFRLRLSLGIVLLVLVASTFVAIKFCDGSSKYGNLYYGHLIPTEIEVSIPLDETESERAVYRYTESASQNELKEKLLSLTGFSGEWRESEETDGTYFSLDCGDGKFIFILPYQTWGVYYEYGGNRKTASETVEKSAALESAWGYLAAFGITENEVTYDADDTTVYSDENYYFTFLPVQQGDEVRICGDVVLELGTDGRLVSVCDNRIPCEYAENTACISMAKSIEIAKSVGCGSWNGKGTVESIEEDYAFIRDTGYLIPIWRIDGTLESDTQTLEWHPEIDAVR